MAPVILPGVAELVRVGILSAYKEPNVCPISSSGDDPELLDDELLEEELLDDELPWKKMEEEDIGGSSIGS
jgi:hypothetical protein